MSFNLMLNEKYTAYLYLKVKACLKSEASKNYLGYFWWVLEPFLMISVLYFVFGALLNRGGQDFVFYLTVGVVFWLWFSNIVSHSVLSILGAGPLINQVYVPKIILPLTIVLVDSFKQSIVIVILLLFMGYAYGVSSAWLALPVLFAVQFLVNTSAALVVSALTPFVPDLRFVVSLGLNMLMFFSGIFYDVSAISKKYHDAFMLNPIANLITQYREVLLLRSWPDWSAILNISIGSIGIIILMALFIKRNDCLYPRLAIR